MLDAGQCRRPPRIQPDDPRYPLPMPSRLARILFSEEITTPPRPFLKWAGGKRQLLRELLPLAPDRFAGYHEPFLGGGAFFFALAAQGRIAAAALNDWNPELIHVYRVVRDRVDDLIAALAAHERAYQDAPSREAYYYAVRAAEPSTDLDRAARFIFLNRTCYNGLYRVNRGGRFNVPFGRYANPAICQAPRLRAARGALRSVTALTCDPFEVALARVQPGDFVYLDPPYYPLSRTASFTGYTRGGFLFEDHERLAREFRRLDRIGARVLLSNSYHEAIERLYTGAGYDVRHVRARRGINSNGAARGPVREIVVRNYT